MSTTRQPSPGNLGPEPDTEQVSVSEATLSHGTISHGTVSNGTFPDGTVPNGAASDAATPDSALTDGSIRTLVLDSASGVVPLARDFTRQALYDWGWLPATTADRRATAEDVLLVVSELVTNACLHAEGPERLSVSLAAKVLRLEVTDRGAGRPEPRTPHRAGRPGGHGMFIVQRLCLDWGVLLLSGTPGKTVWAELAAPA